MKSVSNKIICITFLLNSMKQMISNIFRHSLLRGIDELIYFVLSLSLINILKKYSSDILIRFLCNCPFTSH